MSFYWFLLGLLCVWRVTHLLVAEDGPWRLIARFRQGAGGIWRDLFDCFYCLSLWIAAPVAVIIGEGWVERAFLWPALSAGAIMLERVTAPAESVPAAFVEDEEDRDGMLR